jgi:hypothetical protein
LGVRLRQVWANRTASDRRVWSWHLRHEFPKCCRKPMSLDFRHPSCDKWGTARRGKRAARSICGRLPDPVPAALVPWVESPQSAGSASGGSAFTDAKRHGLPAADGPRPWQEAEQVVTVGRVRFAAVVALGQPVGGRRRESVAESDMAAVPAGDGGQGRPGYPSGRPRAPPLRGASARRWAATPKSVGSGPDGTRILERISTRVPRPPDPMPATLVAQLDP